MIIDLYPAGAKPSSGATLFFAGWGMDANPFKPDFPPDRDCVVCHSYHNLDFDYACLQGYDDLLVAAWSMGVWVAASVLPRSGLRCRAAIAVNGTMNPVDDQRGIPRSVFNGTLTGLTPASLAKFRRRMCPSPEVRARFSAALPQREFDDVLSELETIGSAAGDGAPDMRWDLAVVGQADRIFKATNQLRAWEGNRVLLLPEEGHFLSSWVSIFNGGILA